MEKYIYSATMTNSRRNFKKDTDPQKSAGITTLRRVSSRKMPLNQQTDYLFTTTLRSTAQSEKKQAF